MPKLESNLVELMAKSFVIIIIINTLFRLIQIHIHKDIYSLQESGA